MFAFGTGSKGPESKGIGPGSLVGVLPCLGSGGLPGSEAVVLEDSMVASPPWHRASS